MSDYVKNTNFAVKDGYTTGDPRKTVKGTEIDDEFNSIAGAVSSKADLESPLFTGTPAAPTASDGTNTTQIATTAFVIGERTSTSTLTNKTLVAPVLGTPNSGTLTNCTDLPIVNGTTGTLSVARGGTGLSSVGTAGNVLTSNGTTWTSSALPAGGVTSLNGQTGAITNTDYGAIGSVVRAANTTSSSYLPGATIAGSSLYYPNTFSQASTPASLYSQGTQGSGAYTYWVIDNTARRSDGNTGYQVPAGAATLSGTWRAMYFSNPRESQYYGCDNATFSVSSVSVWVRIS